MGRLARNLAFDDSTGLLSGVARQGMVVQVYVDGQPYATAQASDVLGAWSCDLSAVSPGLHELAAGGAYVSSQKLTVYRAEWNAGYLLDMDYTRGRFFWRGQRPASEAALLAILGGSKSGEARTIGPFVFGPELNADPGFASGVDGWADAPTYAANGDTSQVSGALRLQFTGTASPYRARKATAVQAGHAYYYQLTAASQVGISAGGLTMQASTNTDLGGTDSVAFAQGALPETKSLVTAPNTSTLYTGAVLVGTVSATTRADFDDAVLKECVPFDGYVFGGSSWRVEFTPPATLPSTQVLLQLGTSGERGRVRLHATTDYRLHLVVTRNNSQTDDIDLGLLTAGVATSVEFTLGSGRVIAKLAGNAAKLGSTATVPGLGILWVGRSFTGEAWGGTVGRVSYSADERLPIDALWLEGDSYVAGAGGVSLTASLVGAGRVAITTGVAGTTLDDQLVRMMAKPGYRQTGVLVHWDGSTAGNVDLATAMAKYKQIVSSLNHSRYVIVAPVRLTAATQAINDLTTLVQAGLKAAYPGRVVDAQAILAARATAPGDNADTAAGNVPTSLLQGDLAHLTSAAMGYVMSDPGGVLAMLASYGL